MVGSAELGWVIGTPPTPPKVPDNPWNTQGYEKGNWKLDSHDYELQLDGGESIRHITIANGRKTEELNKVRRLLALASGLRIWWTPLRRHRLIHPLRVLGLRILKWVKKTSWCETEGCRWDWLFST